MWASVLRLLPSGIARYAVVVLAVSAVAIGAAWHYRDLRHQIEVAEFELLAAQSQLNLRDQHVQRLKEMVKTQNTRIDMLDRLSEMRQGELTVARERIEDLQRELVVDVSILQAEEGKSCSDGIALIDKELGL